MKRLCTICARGGSKGVKNKNIRIVGGLPLIAHSIRQAIDSKLFDAVAVSSDSDDILKVAKEYGATFCIRRQDELATDTAPKLPVIQNCVRMAEELSGTSFDLVVDLDCTSPLRSIDDIRDCVKLCEESGVLNVITGCESRRSPYFNLIELSPQGGVQLAKQLEKKVTRRQDAPKCYDMNASIYVWKKDFLFSLDGLFNSGTRLHIMPEERSWDVDSELDMEFVTFLISKRNHE